MQPLPLLRSGTAALEFTLRFRVSRRNLLPSDLAARAPGGRDVPGEWGAVLKRAFPSPRQIALASGSALRAG